jgi:hypothetical protein
MPLGIYPPGMDLTGSIIIWPDGSTDEWSEELLEKWKASQPVQGGAQMDSGGGSEVDSDFFRVFHIPDWAFNVTNYVYDGPTFFPVDFKDYRERVDNIAVLLNGVAISDAVFIEYQGYWGMGIYFDLFTNGTYQIQLQTTVRLNDEVGDGTVSLVLSNLVRTIVVDNEVTFPDWEDLILGTNTIFRAQTKTNVTDWWIDIYDAWNNYVNGGSGHTTNGLIEWAWDLRDTSGNPRNSLDNDPLFNSYITFAAATGGSPVTRRTPAKQINYPNVGVWLVSYSDNHFNDAGTNYAGGHTPYTNGVYGIAGGPALRSIPVSVFPIKFGTNNHTQAERNASWEDLIAIMYSEGRIRNFYYYGHGGPNKIGTDVHAFNSAGKVTGGITLPGSKAFLTSQMVSNRITFNRYGGSRPYRFVWLDGCSTANGNWPGAFGMNKATNSLSWYTNSVTNPSRRRPSAFVGWNQIIGGEGWGTVQGLANCRTQWMFDWQQNWASRSLIQALENGCSSSNWVPLEQFRNAIRAYGYIDLRMNEYNQQHDWP